MRYLCIVVGLGLAACAEPETYPVSGEECGSKDPVQGLDAKDCVPPVTGTGVF